ncbi:MAG: imidazole glycerol phosphate synthase subunit HisF [Parcubacteria group bacterium CG2_30_36_18]|uniref:Imidazole glycerol phosphate synthase subunit HisF n=2 Tax=Candidatus Nealsoniibacteriota TaxID=1817911 RepID=A0A2M8DM72_9BACT|nr:MAG: imidazole glycerol phosphate synthase subunit HisF [Parcubacteria group bacterium CG2_30_36_18]PIX88640.1 MAG: imidazole glycerol phosphate synthase subunit HisF [Candidatus Nealsonbacteria bacterium CG_4_10_14_3_um_filter_36_16]PJB99010.1 MAG: imidazole glycerol phosphate synthase subunit HisF [Candidatus Nealsonbacteria bacterium CG_4_9_14_0_8_um_filter_36_17]
MLAHRIIPCLDCDLEKPGGRVVKGIKFKKIRYTGLPWELAERYYKEGADEIVFLDITASAEKRTTMVEVVKKTCQKVFIPITVGGGIRSVEDAQRLFRAGADKISINTAAIQNPKLVKKLSKTFGSQAVVVAIDAKSRGNWFECSIYGGRKFTGVDAILWAKKVAELGAGEILLTSMDRDGTKEGFDLELTKRISKSVFIPVIASGGAGKKEHFLEAFTKGKADATLAASLFHFREIKISELKRYLKEKVINVR